MGKGRRVGKGAKVPKKRGAPRFEFRQSIADRICREVSLGKSLRRVLKAKGLPKMTTVMKWLQERPEFAHQYARARERGMELHIDGILDLADTANASNAHAVRLKVDVRKWLASKLLPKVYGDRFGLDVEVSDRDGEVSDEDLARWLSFEATRSAVSKARAEGIPLLGAAPAPHPNPAPAGQQRIPDPQREIEINPRPEDRRQRGGLHGYGGHAGSAAEQGLDD